MNILEKLRKFLEELRKREKVDRDISEKKRAVITAIILFSIFALVTTILPYMYGAPGAIVMFVILVAMYYVLSEVYLRRRLYG